MVAANTALICHSTGAIGETPEERLDIHKSLGDIV